MRRYFIAAAIFVFWAIVLIVDATATINAQNQSGISTSDIRGCWDFNARGEYVDKCAEAYEAKKTAWVLPLILAVTVLGFGLYKTGKTRVTERFQ